MQNLSWVAHILNCSSSDNRAIQGFSTDTRLLKPGEVFVALAGERVDGHAYLKEAEQKGAAAAIVNHIYQGSTCSLPLLRVEDPLQALQKLAQAHLSAYSPRVVAVTGSVGKTTTKEFIKTVLERRYLVSASPGNSNSQVGTPLAILNHASGQEEILILEMGMTEPGQLSRLVQIAPPEVAVLTCAALVHACNFETLEAIAWAKAEIFSHSHTKLGILHRDLVNYAAIKGASSCRKLSFSLTNPQADYWLDNDRGLLHDSLEGQAVEWPKLSLPGRHNAHNFLAVALVGRYFKLSWEEIKQAIPLLALPDKRLQFVQKAGILFLNDSYNASELSVKGALETLPAPKMGGSKIAVLGSMMELGKFSDDCHRRVGEFALQHVDQMYCLGAECQPIYEIWKSQGKTVELFEDRSSLVAHLKKALKPSDVVLLKGSRSKELWKVLDFFRN